VGDLLVPWQEKPLTSVRGEWPALAVLQDARVLVAGGVTMPDDPSTSLASADLFDRQTETISPAAGAMSTVRWRAAAVTLLDGRALVVGGACWDDLTGCSGMPQSADLFDPQTGNFASAAAP